MVRISWHSKPKLRDGRLFFSRRGRSSEITNEWLNRFLAEYSGFGTEVIATGNAGEHAMTLDLGLKLRLAGGFAVEPYEYLDLFEQFGGVLESTSPEVMASSVPVLQIETRNPHFHDNKGEEHVQGMRMQALNVRLPLAGDPARGPPGDPRLHGGPGRPGARSGTAARAGLPAGRHARRWTCSYDASGRRGADLPASSTAGAAVRRRLPTARPRPIDGVHRDPASGSCLELAATGWSVPLFEAVRLTGRTLRRAASSCLLPWGVRRGRPGRWH